MKLMFMGTFSEICGQAVYLEHQVLAWRKEFPIDKIVIASEAGIAPKRSVSTALLEPDILTGKFYSVESWNRKDQNFDNVTHLCKVNDFDIVNVSHEWGLFGFPAGEGGIYNTRPSGDDRFIDFVHNVQALGTPVTITLHTPALYGDISKYFAKLDAAHYIVQGSKADLDVLVKKHKIDASKCSFIPHPIAPYEHNEESIDDVRIRLALPTKAVIMLVTGFWRFEMNMQKILVAFKIIHDYLRQNNRRVWLVFAGTVHPTDKAPVRDYIKQCMLWAARQGLSKSVVFTNRFHSEEELDDYLYACDIVLNYREFVTNSTSISAAALRAIAAGKPLIAWDSVGVKQLSRDICVKVKDEGEMANEAINLIEHPSLMETLISNEVHYYSSGSWNAAVHDYRQLFERVITNWKSHN